MERLSQAGQEPGFVERNAKRVRNASLAIAAIGLVFIPSFAVLGAIGIIAGQATAEMAKK